jgi:hypothetical protein
MKKKNLFSVIVIIVIFILLIIACHNYYCIKEGFELGEIVRMQDKIDAKQAKIANEHERAIFTGSTEKIVDNIFRTPTDPFWYSKILGERWSSRANQNPDNELIRREIGMGVIMPVKDFTKPLDFSKTNSGFVENFSQKKEGYLVDTVTPFEEYMRTSWYYSPSPRNNFPCQKGMSYPSVEKPCHVNM